MNIDSSTVPTKAGPSAAPAIPSHRFRGGQPAGILAGITGMVFVGGSVAVSGTLQDSPVLTGQAVRYLAACLVLVLLARVAKVRLHLPRGREWCWLAGIAVTGLVIFNLALIEGSRHAEPAVLGVAVACVPVVLAVVGPMLERRKPHCRVILAAVVVTAGAALVEGGGRSDPVGLLWAVVVLICEAAFTLMALPVLGRHGAWGVSVHSTWLAAVVLGGMGLVTEGPSAITQLTGANVLALGYLTLGVTAVAFLLWYTCVGRIGAGRAGLLTGIAPAAAAGVGIALGAPVPGLPVWLGIALVGAGLTVGLTARHAR